MTFKSTLVHQYGGGTSPLILTNVLLTNLSFGSPGVAFTPDSVAKLSNDSKLHHRVLKPSC